MSDIELVTIALALAAIVVSIVSACIAFWSYKSKKKEELFAYLTAKMENLYGLILLPQNVFKLTNNKSTNLPEFRLQLKNVSHLADKELLNVINEYTGTGISFIEEHPTTPNMMGVAEVDKLGARIVEMARKDREETLKLLWSLKPDSSK